MRDLEWQDEHELNHTYHYRPKGTLTIWPTMMKPLPQPQGTPASGKFPEKQLFHTSHEETKKAK